VTAQQEQSIMSKKASKTTKPSNATKPAAKQVVKAQVIAREQHNGVTRPGAETLCGRVWAALDKLRAKGEDATFGNVRLLSGKEMADATIRTQRQRWNEFHGMKRDSKKSTPKKVAAKHAHAAVVTAEVQPVA
jgi:hypothetical protein